MSETYEIIAPNGVFVTVDKQTNEVIFEEREDGKETGKYTKEYSKALLEAWQIMEQAKSKYKPLYLDPTLKSGQASTLLEFNAWRDLYLKEPPKGKIAPWTNKEKAYYESLQTKRERYKYLVIRSGIRSSVIDIPFDAIANVDENGKLINEEYAELYAIVEANRGMAHLSDGSLTMAEWEIAAGMLGDIKGLGALRTEGFTARTYQKRVLVHQLGNIWKTGYYGYGSLIDGQHKNPLREAQMINLVKKIKPDRFGMYPYIDEIMGVEWIMDFNMLYGYAADDGSAMDALDDQLIAGTLKDPRDMDSTKESREKFHKESRLALGAYLEDHTIDIRNDWTQKQADIYIYCMLLDAKVMAVTPPQGYPNAPTYYIPEYLDELYEAGKLDKKLNPTIPAIYRESFPQELRNKIEWYAKKHNIRD